VTRKSGEKSADRLQVLRVIKCKHGCQINFNEKKNNAKKRPKKGQTDCLKARKKPNFICGIAIPLSQKHLNYKNIKKNFSSKLRLNLAWHCTGALIFPDFSWFVILHTLGKMVPQFAY